MQPSGIRHWRCLALVRLGLAWIYGLLLVFFARFSGTGMVYPRKLEHGFRMMSALIS